MENIVLGASFNNRLPDEKVAKLLPALSLVAEDVGEKISLDSNSLREILVSVGADQEKWAYEELTLWLKSLDKVKDHPNNVYKDAVIVELKNRGVPEFPAMLAVYVVTNQQANPTQIEIPPSRVSNGRRETVTRRVKVNQYQRVRSSAGLNRRELPDKPVEPYHRLLPDHGWHNDIAWEQLPEWIKANPKLIARLKRGEQVIGRNVRYRFIANKLIRRLRYRVSVASHHRVLKRYTR